MTVRTSPTLAGLENRTLEDGGFPAETHRLGTAGLLTPGAGLHARGGILPAPAGYRGEVTLLGSVLTVKPFRAVIVGTQSAVQGDYTVVNDADVTVTATGPHPTLGRLDVLVTYVRDTAYLPNEGADDVVGPVLLPGTPAPVPAAPTLPPNCLLHGTLTVPASGGTPTWAPTVQASPVTLGGIPPTTGALLGTVGGYDGQYRHNTDTGDLERWDAAGGEWVVASGSGGSGTVVTYDVQEFPTAGGFTWTKPVGAVRATVDLVGGGGGGSGGGLYTAANYSAGGFGGSGAARSQFQIDATALPATVAVTVGAGGAGGAGGTSIGGDSTAGGNGASTQFGSYLAPGGWGGPSALGAGSAPGAGGDFPGGSGAMSGAYSSSALSTTAGIAIPGGSSSGPGGGGGGGRYVSATSLAATAGGSGGPSSGGAAGATVATGTAAPAGATATLAANSLVGGGGGGGGLYNTTGGSGGAGGAGIRGGGGGGGGGTRQATAGTGAIGGAGGAGGAGYARVVTVCLTALDGETLPDTPIPNTSWDVQAFTAAGSFTWTKPAGALYSDVLVVGGGTGGQSGGGVNGGAGGGGGAKEAATIAASALAATVAVTVGAGGAGGVAGTLSALGAAGGNSSFGSAFTALGASPGATAGAVGTGTGGAGGTSGAGSRGTGGAGGGGTGGASTTAGFAGGPAPGAATGAAGGAVSTTGGVPGGVGVTGTAPTGSYIGGGGGGGGGSNVASTVGGTGGAGVYGGGGGGAGGALTNTAPYAGAGGKGGDGVVVVRTLTAVAIGTAPGGVPAIAASEKAAPNGVATLGSDSRVPASQLPVVLTAYKTADTARSSTAVLADDPDLVFPNVPVGTYIVDGVVFALGATTSPDIALTLAAGTAVLASSAWAVLNTYGLSGTSAAPLVKGANPFGTSQSFGLDVTSQAQPLTGTVEVSTAGSIALRWAQAASSASYTAMQRGSFLRLTRIA